MRLFFRRRIPDLRRILLVESGTRDLFDRFLPALGKEPGGGPSVDLLTCYGGVPEGFNESRGAVYRVGDYPTGEARSRLLGELKSNGYDAVGIICSGEPILMKWKWAVVAKVPAKLFVMNENGDYFWADYTNWRTIRHFILFRAGLSGAEAAPALARLLLFPFTVLYLVCYAAFVHTRRRIRLS